MRLCRNTPLHQHNCSRFLSTLYTSRFPKGVKGFIHSFIHYTLSKSADQVRCSRHSMAALQPALSWEGVWG